MLLLLIAYAAMLALIGIWNTLTEALKFNVAHCDHHLPTPK